MENTVLFVGDRGVGKSFLCTQILNMCKSPLSLESEASHTAVTGPQQQVQITFQGKPFSVVECPGLFYPEEEMSAETCGKIDGGNLCKLVRALENCKDICCVVFVFTRRFGCTQKVWYDRIIDLIGADHRGQLIIVQNKLEVFSEEQLIRNETTLRNTLGAQYFPIVMAQTGSSEGNMTRLKDQLNRLLCTVSKFVPFSLKNMKVPEICYEKEVKEGPFERELANYKSCGCHHRRRHERVPLDSESPLLRLFGGKEKMSVYEVHKEDEVVHVPQDFTRRVIGIFWRTYKVRFDGTRDFIKEELVEEKVEKY